MNLPQSVSDHQLLAEKNPQDSNGKAPAKESASLTSFETSSTSLPHHPDSGYFSPSLSTSSATHYHLTNFSYNNLDAEDSLLSSEMDYDNHHQGTLLVRPESGSALPESGTDRTSSNRCWSQLSFQTAYDEEQTLPCLQIATDFRRSALHQRRFEKRRREGGYWSDPEEQTTSASSQKDRDDPHLLARSKSVPLSLLSTVDVTEDVFDGGRSSPVIINQNQPSSSTSFEGESGGDEAGPEHHFVPDNQVDNHEEEEQDDDGYHSVLQSFRGRRQLLSMEAREAYRRSLSPAAQLQLQMLTGHLRARADQFEAAEMTAAPQFGMVHMNLNPPENQPENQGEAQQRQLDGGWIGIQMGGRVMFGAFIALELPGWAMDMIHWFTIGE